MTLTAFAYNSYLWCILCSRLSASFAHINLLAYCMDTDSPLTSHGCLYILISQFFSIVGGNKTSSTVTSQNVPAGYKLIPGRDAPGTELQLKRTHNVCICTSYLWQIFWFIFEIPQHLKYWACLSFLRSLNIVLRIEDVALITDIECCIVTNLIFQVMKESNSATTNKTPRLIKQTQMTDIVNNSPVPPVPQELKKAEVSCLLLSISWSSLNMCAVWDSWLLSLLEIFKTINESVAFLTDSVSKFSAFGDNSLLEWGPFHIYIDPLFL